MWRSIHGEAASGNTRARGTAHQLDRPETSCSESGLAPAHVRRWPLRHLATLATHHLALGRTENEACGRVGARAEAKQNGRGEHNASSNDLSSLPRARARKPHKSNTCPAEVSQQWRRKQRSFKFTRCALVSCWRGCCDALRDRGRSQSSDAARVTYKAPDLAAGPGGFVVSRRVQMAPQEPDLSSRLASCRFRVAGRTGVRHSRPCLLAHCSWRHRGCYGPVHEGGEGDNARWLYFEMLKAVSGVGQAPPCEA